MERKERQSPSQLETKPVSYSGFCPGTEPGLPSNIPLVSLIHCLLGLESMQTYTIHEEVVTSLNMFLQAFWLM